MTYIVRHHPDRSNNDDAIVYGPFETRELADRYCTHLDWGKWEKVISFAIELTPPIGTPDEWPQHMTYDEAVAAGQIDPIL